MLNYLRFWEHRELCGLGAVRNNLWAPSRNVILLPECLSRFWTVQIKSLSVYCLPWLFPASTPVLTLLKTGESVKNECFAFHMQSPHTQRNTNQITKELHFPTLQASTCFVTLLGHCTDEHVGKHDTDFITCLQKYFQEDLCNWLARVSTDYPKSNWRQSLWL